MYAPPNYTVLCLRCLSLGGSSCKGGRGERGLLEEIGEKNRVYGESITERGERGAVVWIYNYASSDWISFTAGWRDERENPSWRFVLFTSFVFLSSFFSSHSSSSPFFLFKLEKATCYPTMLLGFLVSWKQIAALHISAILRREQASASKFPM